MQQQHRVAIFAHLFAVDLWPEFRSYLANFENIPFDLYVNLVADTWFPGVTKSILKSYPNAKLVISENKGRDIGGLFNLLQVADLYKYDSCIFMHTKKSVHLPNGDEWRNDLIQALMGCHEAVVKNMWLFENTKTGMIGNKKYTYTLHDHWDTNEEKVSHLCRVMGIDINKIKPPKIRYVAGTILWVHCQIMRYIKYHVNGLKSIGLAKGQGALDGGWEHAFERIFALISNHLGLELAEVDPIKEHE
jgi:lipopolysaccharide biosynthesis protein